MITLGHGELHHCDGCDRYVGAEGELLDGREGRIRRALAEAGDEPRRIDELRAMLRSDSEDELGELVVRHRELIGDWTADVILPETVRRRRVVGREGEYRTGPVRPSRQLRVDTRLQRRALGAGAVLGVVGFSLSFVTLVTVTVPLVGAKGFPLAFGFSVFTGVLLGWTASHGFAPPPKGSVLTLRWTLPEEEVEVDGFPRQGLRFSRSGVLVCVEERRGDGEWFDVTLRPVDCEPFAVHRAATEKGAREIALFFEWELELGPGLGTERDPTS
jgi:hypothetical protein